MRKKPDDIREYQSRSLAFSRTLHGEFHCFVRFHEIRAVDVESLETFEPFCNLKYRAPCGLLSNGNRNCKLVVLDEEENWKRFSRRPVHRLKEFSLARRTLAGRDVHDFSLSLFLCRHGHAHCLEVLCPCGTRLGDDAQF